MKRDIQLSVRYAHSPQRVWQALTRSDAIAAWLMPNDFEPRVGHRFTLRTDPAPGFDGIVRCEVLEMEEPSRMVWSWRGGSIDTVVTFQLTPDGDGTTLHFEQTGFQGLPAVLTSFILGQGSKRIYRKLLPAVLDQLASGQLPPQPEKMGCEGDLLERAAGHAVGALTK